MSPFTRFALRSAPALATVLAGAALFVWGKWVMHQDPFEDYRRQPELDSNVGIRLMGVQLWHYQGSSVDTRATCARIDVDPQRQHLILANIDNGWTRSKKGEFKFSAKSATWNDSAKALSVNAGARVYAKDFDLRSDTVEFDKREGLLIVSSPLSGRLMDGTVTAERMRYNLDKGSYFIRHPDWEGNLVLDQGDKGQKEKPTRWHITSPDTVSSVNGQEVWPNAVANTTDGETIIRATKVVRDTKTDIITATGNVQYFSTKLNMTCDQAVVDKKIKKAVFTGKVHCYFKAQEEQKAKVAIVEIPPFRPMVPDEIASQRPAAPPVSDEDKQLNEELRSDKTARKYPVTAQAAKIEYWYAKGDRHAEISGDPQARQDFPKGKWRHVWTVSAHYDGEQERLRLYGTMGKQQTRIRTSADDDCKANWFEISTKDDDDKDWKANGMDGTVSVDDDDETGTSKPASTSPDKKKGKKEDAPKTQPAPLQGTIPG